MDMKQLLIRTNITLKSYLMILVPRWAILRDKFVKDHGAVHISII
jgi:hypothetical protein